MSARLLAASALTLTLALTLPAADWPQWRGPTRDGVAAGFTAPAAWPKELQKGWSVKVGEGVATPALAGGKLYAFGWEGGREVLRCLDAATGREVWKEGYATTPATGAAGGFPAARSSPAVADGKVVTFGVRGVLTCRDAATGRQLWQKTDTGDVPGFSASCSPLVADGVCVVQVGGDRGRGAAVVAFDLATGDEKWRWAADGTKYASPTVVDISGLRAVVAETSGTVSAIGLADGKVLWQEAFASKYNASTPVAAGGLVIYGGAGKANTAVALERTGDALASRKAWANDENPVQFASPAVRDGLLYGIGQDGTVFCIDTATGKTQWTGRPSAAPPAGGGKGKGKGGGGGGYGSVVVAGPALLALTPAGTLTVLDAGRAEYKELAKYRVAAGGTYAYPVADGTSVFVRDRDSVTRWTVE